MDRKVESIIFDLGGVLYDINYEETFILLGDLLAMDLTLGNWPNEFELFVLKYETGKINTETFIWNLQRMSRNLIPQPYDVIKCWNAMLKGWHDGIQDMLKELKKDFNLYLLSNINELHYHYLERSFDHQDGLKPFTNLFNGVAFSHLIGHRKPDALAFKYLINKYGIEPSKTVFIDDFKHNIDAAQTLGFQVVCHDNVNSIVDEIISYL